MKIFSANQMKKWDAFTIEHEPISSIDLMEIAATACFNWLIKNNFSEKHFLIFCGKGNNGGDGLAIARLLIQNNCKVSVYILETDNEGSNDYKTNLDKLRLCGTVIKFISSPDSFPSISDNNWVIDAIFGTGLNKPLKGIYADLVNYINQNQATVISIDLPSGLFADASSKNNIVTNATHTLSFQIYKLAFLLAENENHCGAIHILDIGLNKKFYKEETSAFELTDKEIISSIYKPRKKFSHKGTFGHAALITGSYGMMGAAVMSASACLRAGAGKLTSYIPKCGYQIFQTSIPEAMCIVAGDEYITSVNGIEKFDAVGIGPGIGLYPSNKNLLKEIFQSVKNPMLIDADALNIISQHKELLNLVPAHSILTPHPKEFERLFGTVSNDFERLNLALQKSKEYKIFIILKGHFSFISTPEGKGYFNSTGNAGMAKAGSGDVLTGIITALLAQRYNPFQACILGTYLHGLAGDIAAEKFSQEAMIATDIINCLSTAFLQLKIY